MPNEKEPTNRDLAKARDALIKLSGLPDAPGDDLATLAKSIDDDLKAKELAAPIIDLGFTLEQLVNVDQILRIYLAKNPGIDPKEVERQISIQQIFAATRADKQPKPLLARVISGLSVLVPDYKPVPTPKPFKRSVYMRRSGMSLPQEPLLTKETANSYYFTWQDPDGEQILFHPQRISFSEPTETNKSLEISSGKIGVILAGESQTDGKEISILGFIDPFILDRTSELGVNLPLLIEQFCDTTRPDTRRVGVVGGNYPQAGVSPEDFSDRNQYKNMIRAVNRLTEYHLNVDAEVLIGPISKLYGGTEVF